MLRSLVWLAVMAGPISAGILPPADIYVLGEQHDNPAHHLAQAEMITEIAPTAIVLEHLTDEQADRLTPDTPRTVAGLEAVFDWSNTGWPDLAMFLPIFTASDAVIRGAAGAPGDLSAFGLDQPLPEDQQAAREQLQADAHCGALPEAMLPQFVDRQRAVDAQFAARVLEAFETFGGPVVLVTGNGHAREDWGVPAALAAVRPDLAVVSVLQGEDGRTPAGGNALVLDAPAPAREDPCEAFLESRGSQ